MCCWCDGGDNFIELIWRWILKQVVAAWNAFVAIFWRRIHCWIHTCITSYRRTLSLWICLWVSSFCSSTWITTHQYFSYFRWGTYTHLKVSYEWNIHARSKSGSDIILLLWTSKAQLLLRLKFALCFPLISQFMMLFANLQSMIAFEFASTVTSPAVILMNGRRGYKRRTDDDDSTLLWLAFLRHNCTYSTSAKRSYRWLKGAARGGETNDLFPFVALVSLNFSFGLFLSITQWSSANFDRCASSSWTAANCQHHKRQPPTPSFGLKNMYGVNHEAV